MGFSLHQMDHNSVRFQWFKSWSHRSPHHSWLWLPSFKISSYAYWRTVTGEFLTAIPDSRSPSPLPPSGLSRALSHVRSDHRRWMFPVTVTCFLPSNPISSLIVRREVISMDSSGESISAEFSTEMTEKKSLINYLFRFSAFLLFSVLVFFSLSFSIGFLAFVISSVSFPSNYSMSSQCKIVSSSKFWFSIFFLWFG